MYSIILTNGKTITITADEVEYLDNARMIRFIRQKTVVGRINMDNVIGWIKID